MMKEFFHCHGEAGVVDSDKCLRLPGHRPILSDTFYASHFSRSSPISPKTLSSLLFLFLSLAAVSAHADSLATLTVNAGASARVDTPVSAVLPAGLAAYRPMRLVEIKGNDRVPVPYQVDPAESNHLWWILGGRTEAGATRSYELLADAPFMGDGDHPAVEANLGCAALTLVCQGATVFKYNHAFVVPPEGVARDFIRSGYIQPLLSPSGRLMTEDFPKDHLHHKGIWFPWTHTEFEGHEVDFWNLGDKKGTVRFAGFGPIFSGPIFGGFIAKHEFVDLTQNTATGGKVALNEEWDVRVYNVGGPKAGYWLFDFQSTQNCAGSSPLKLLEYRYGGLGFRGAKEWRDENYAALSSEGKTHLNGHTTRAKWCDHFGRGNAKPDGSGAEDWNGVTIMDHPKNFRFPQSMRLWDKGGCFFCYAPVQLGDSEIKPGEPYISRYRFFVHEGAVNVDETNRVWNDFADPPAVQINSTR
ncbi:PmoA family protein [Candidatus Sumerlaeota bacterium]|nr:PmoA family protein [Candidatus Sumerlaeota bacterium]MBI3737330.1 PmoA family protein [Candidatus Sumerlaeota bacterium]